MIYMFIYWTCLVVGFILSRSLARKNLNLSGIQNVLMIIVYIMCFVMGIRMGANEKVIMNLGTIGLQGFVITVFTIAGSIGFITILRKFFHMNKEGDVVTRSDKRIVMTTAEETLPAQSDGQTKQNNSMVIKSTVIIIGVVAAGLLIGYLVIFKNMNEVIPLLNDATDKLMVFLISLLLFIVGADLARSESIFQDFKAAGIKVLLFPIAGILGTLVIGTIGGIIMGFTIREGMAISLGFGWYTYAPIVIANAGQQYAIASAVSFMHNVIRELTGIIFIPLIAKKFGYIECAAVPGVAASDVCLPIVTSATKADTVVYSLAMGFMMCFVTTVGVSLVMGI